MTHNILFIVNNYSYFNNEPPTGPKSLIKLLEICSENKNNIFIYIKNNHKEINFGIKNLKILKDANIFVKPNLFVNCIKVKPDIIIVDRANIVFGFFLKMIMNKPLVLRMLGRGKRLQSLKFISYRNLLMLMSHLIPFDLIIETIDGSYPLSDRFLKSKTYRQRINGVTKRGLGKKDNKKFVTVSRFSSEKKLNLVVERFNSLNQERNFELNIFGCNREEFMHKYKNINIDHVKFMGFRSITEIEKALAVSHTFISGNTLGCLGNAELEAISFNCKILYLHEILQKSIPQNLLRFFNQTSHENINQKEIPGFHETHFEDYLAISQLIK